MKIFLMIIILAVSASSTIFAQKLEQSFIDQFPLLEKTITDTDIRNLLRENKFLNESHKKIINASFYYPNRDLLPIARLETDKAVILIYATIGEEDNVEDREIFVNSIAYFRKNSELVYASINLHMTGSGKTFTALNKATIEVSGKEYVFIYEEKGLETGRKKKTTSVYSVKRNCLSFERSKEE